MSVVECGISGKRCGWQHGEGAGVQHDHALALYPVPHVLVLADSVPSDWTTFEGCQVFNPVCPPPPPSSRFRCMHPWCAICSSVSVISASSDGATVGNGDHGMLVLTIALPSSGYLKTLRYLLYRGHLQMVRLQRMCQPKGRSSFAMCLMLKATDTPHRLYNKSQPLHAVSSHRHTKAFTSLRAAVLRSSEPQARSMFNAALFKPIQDAETRSQVTVMARVLIQ